MNLPKQRRGPGRPEGRNRVPLPSITVSKLTLERIERGGKQHKNKGRYLDLVLEMHEEMLRLAGRDPATLEIVQAKVG